MCSSGTWNWRARVKRRLRRRSGITPA
jgi:hypothetical protein